MNNKKINLNNKYIDKIKKVNSLYLNIYKTKQINEITREIISKNEKLNIPHVFYWWLKQNYEYSLVLQVIKLIDPDNRSVSLLTLMRKLIEDRHLSEDQYYSLWKNKLGLSENDIKEEFNRIINKNGACCAIDMITMDIKNLQEKCKKLKVYRNKILAHNNKQSIEYKITYNEIDKIIDFLKELIEKYYLLLTANSLSFDDLTDFDLVNFDSIFKFSWIENVSKINED
ncbi:MAG: hypothetical protein WCF95_02000 [bacterium]